MTELDLYKFIQTNDIEWHYAYNKETDTEDIVIFVDNYLFEDFALLIKPYSEEGFAVYMKDGCIAAYMFEICDYYGIDSTKIFHRDY